MAKDTKRMLPTRNSFLRIIQSILPVRPSRSKCGWPWSGVSALRKLSTRNLTIERALDTYAKKGYPPEWINQRMQTIRARKELTDAWAPTVSKKREKNTGF